MKLSTYLCDNCGAAISLTQPLYTIVITPVNDHAKQTMLELPDVCGMCAAVARRALDEESQTANGRKGGS